MMLTDCPPTYFPVLFPLLRAGARALTDPPLGAAPPPFKADMRRLPLQHSAQTADAPVLKGGFAGNGMREHAIGTGPKAV